MEKKFGIDWKWKLSSKSEPVALISWSVLDKHKRFEIDDVVFVMTFLELDEIPFDHVYSGYNIQEFVSNKNYDLSFFFADADKRICMSIICKNNEAKERLEKILNKIKELNEDKMLMWK